MYGADLEGKFPEVGDLLLEVRLEWLSELVVYLVRERPSHQSCTITDDTFTNFVCEGPQFVLKDIDPVAA